MSDDLNKLLVQSMKIEDDGFTAQVMKSLPLDEQSVFSKSQIILWGVSIAVMSILVICASVQSSSTSLSTTSFFAIGLVSLAICWIHFDEVRA